MPAGISAWTPLANITLSSDVSSVTFSSISQSYRDLVLVCNFNAYTNTAPGLRMNSDAASNYVTTRAGGNGSSTGAWTFGDNFMLLGEYSSAAGLSRVQIFDYSATDKHKTAIINGNNNGAFVNMLASRWANTSAVTTLTVVRSSSGLIASGSSFALYGVSS